MIMEKKQYMHPLTQVEVLNTRELMKVSSESELLLDPGPASAPARDKVF